MRRISAGERHLGNRAVLPDVDGLGLRAPALLERLNRGFESTVRPAPGAQLPLSESESSWVQRLESVIESTLVRGLSLSWLSRLS